MLTIKFSVFSFLFSCFSLLFLLPLYSSYLCTSFSFLFFYIWLCLGLDLSFSCPEINTWLAFVTYRQGLSMMLNARDCPWGSSYIFPTNFVLSRFYWRWIKLSTAHGKNSRCALALSFLHFPPWFSAFSSQCLPAWACVIVKLALALMEIANEISF